MGLEGQKFIDFVLVYDSSKRLKGVCNHADILRLLSDGGNLEAPVSTIMSHNPIVSSSDFNTDQIINDVKTKVLKASNGRKEYVRFVPLINRQGDVVDVIDIFSALANHIQRRELVEIFGLGFVGLTLAVSLASKGHTVAGIDKNSVLVEKLNQGIPHIHEPRLKSLLSQSLKSGSLTISDELSNLQNRIKIIAVGTPVDNDGKASLTAIKSVSTTIGKKLRRNDLVLLRSTVPVGTTREIVLGILEKESGLKGGVDFNLAFTPERTVEGNAIHELSSLPQIIGGLTKRCAEQASKFWSTLTQSTVFVESLEAAEMVKLLNNSYRDLSFSFSNAFALLADKYNLDANKVINAANDGYPRNPIPRPSPGVGGYCLTKDPFLYSSQLDSGFHGKLSKLGRRINEEAAVYPVNIVQRFVQNFELNPQDMTVCIAGIAFKGLPETNDHRGSISVDVAEKLTELGFKVTGFDAVMTQEEIIETGITPVDVESGVNTCDVYLILNNHPHNIPSGLLSGLSNRHVLLFDGWSMIDKSEVEQYETITYSTMGYMTSFNDA